MAFDAFLKIDGIDGEAAASTGHEKWIELLSFSWRASQSLSIGSATGGAGAGKATAQPFSFTKKTDTASPEIFLKLCRGTLIKSATLECRHDRGGNSGGSTHPNPFLKLEFFDVFFSDYGPAGDASTSVPPMEAASFAFQKIVYSVSEVLPTGLMNTSSESWDFLTNSQGTTPA